MIDLCRLVKPYVAFTDSFNLAFMEMHFSENLKQRFQASNLDEVEGILQYIDGNKEIILSRIIDPENKEVQTRMGALENKLAELKSLAAGLIAEQSQPVVADLEYEEIDDEPSFAADFFGTWTGNKGDEVIEIVFNSVHGDSIFGYTTVDQTKRPLAGLVTSEAEGYTFSLLEPGDEEGAGAFRLKMNPGSDYEAVGEWVANNGTSSENVHIKLQ